MIAAQRNNVANFLGEAARQHRLNDAASRLRLGQDPNTAFAALATADAVQKHSAEVLGAMGDTLALHEAERDRLKTRHASVLAEAGVLNATAAVVSEIREALAFEKHMGGEDVDPS